MKTFKFDEPLVLKLLNGDVLSVTYLGNTEDGLMVVKPIQAQEDIPPNSELYIDSANVAWIARRAAQVASAVDNELFDGDLDSLSH